MLENVREAVIPINENQCSRCPSYSTALLIKDNQHYCMSCLEKMQSIQKGDGTTMVERNNNARY